MVILQSDTSAWKWNKDWWHGHIPTPTPAKETQMNGCESTDKEESITGSTQFKTKKKCLIKINIHIKEKWSKTNENSFIDEQVLIRTTVIVLALELLVLSCS